MVQKATTNRGLAYLLVVALFLCHGAFGTLHLFPAPSAIPESAGEHQTLQVSHDGGSEVGHVEDPVYHGEVMEYFAVLVGVLLASIPRLLGNARRRGIAVPRLLGGPSPAVFTNLPRGPTLPAMQVFRL